jgi:nucleoside-diphosphate-sugar epimerase
LSTLNANQVKILDGSILNVLPRLDLQGLERKSLFITGGTGFFGIWLLSALRVMHQQGVALKITVLSRNPESFLSRHPQFRDQSWLSFIVGNVCDFSIPQNKFDLLLHAATETSIAAHEAPQRMFDTIVLGTRRVLELAQLCGVSRILLISSGAVYGKQPADQIHQPDDSQLACNPLLASSAYGEGKRVMELMGAMLQKESGIEFVTARCFAFCGPGLPLDGHYAIGNFIRDALYREKIIVKGDGSPIRSYLYGADLAVSLLFMLLHGKAGESYNVGCDEALTIKDLAVRVRDVLSPGKHIDIQHDNEKTQSTRNCYVPSIDRARALGCVPWTSLEESLKFTASYWNAS